jgi:hypothetical protein
VAADDEQHDLEYDRLVFMARKLRDGLGSNVFLLESAANSHIVRGGVILKHEKVTDTEIRGLADVRARAI